jgi:thiol-disulfide isomerase/thioredoxin
VLFLILLLQVLAFQGFASGRIILKDGSGVGFAGEVSEEMRMLSLTTPKGKILLSKTLVDWNATWYTAAQVVERYKPEIAKQEASAQAKRESMAPKPPIVIDNDALANLKPDQGLVKHWTPDPELVAMQKKLAAEKAAEAKAEKSGKRKRKRDRKDEKVEPTAPGGPIIQTISSGQKVDLDKHMESGRYVLFDFYADWCGPCRQLTPKLEQLVRRYPSKVSLKKIDIVNWSSPVARQYGIQSIPYVRAYDPNGRLATSGNGGRVLTFIERMAVSEKW